MENYNRLDEEMETIIGDVCEWHGSDGRVLYIDESEVALVVGVYDDDEFNGILDMFNNDEDMGEYEDYIVSADREEFDEQNML